MNDITALARYGINEQGVFTNNADGAYVSYQDYLALVEALEKAQGELAKANGVLDKIKSTSCHVDTSDGAVIPNSLDAWGRPVPQHLPYDFSGNSGASATQYCNGWNDAGGYWLNYVRELESRTVTVKLPKRTVSEVMLLSGFDRQYAEGWCAGNDNARHEIRAAGIQVTGEEAPRSVAEQVAVENARLPFEPF